jgi:hypothetical protein
MAAVAVSVDPGAFEHRLRDLAEEASRLAGMIAATGDRHLAAALDVAAEGIDEALLRLVGASEHGEHAQ